MPSTESSQFREFADAKEAAPGRPVALLAAGVLCILLVAVLAGATLGVSRRGAAPADAPAAVQPQAEAVASVAKVEQAAAAEPPATKPPAMKSRAVKSPVARTQRRTPARAPTAPALPAAMPAVEATALTGESASRELVEAPVGGTPAAESASSALVLEPGDVTITGCLEHNDNGFRLKDTAGVDVPKSRSWKSGFLRKRPASINVAEVADGLQLSNHVGQRVSVTGLLQGREMDVRSLQRVAEYCD